jgi:spermine oxidase
MMNLIIIGAGASGLAAASRLIERGLDPTKITILEAENRIGGRIFTVPHGNFFYFKMDLICY